MGLDTLFTVLTILDIFTNKTDKNMTAFLDSVSALLLLRPFFSISASVVAS